MSALRSTIRRIAPASILEVYDGYRQQWLASLNRRLTTESIFTKIYSTNRWGGSPGTFFSGRGSAEAAIVLPYVEAVASELQRLGSHALSAVDLGCGDFGVGRRLAPLFARYTGVDIVKPLVERNQAVFGCETLNFAHANIVEDPIPHADVCFVRQVFQHLSNAQIAAVLLKLEQFAWCFITEHHASPEKTRGFNIDKPHGDNIRVAQGSGIYLDAPPFNVPAARLRLLLEVAGSPTLDGSDRGVIRTYLLTREASSW